MATLQKDVRIRSWGSPVGLSFNSVRPDVSSPSWYQAPFVAKSHSFTEQRYLPWSLSPAFRMCSWNVSWETLSVWNFCFLHGVWNSSPYFTTLVRSISRIFRQGALVEMEEKYQVTANWRFPVDWDKMWHSMSVLELMGISWTWLLEFTFRLLSKLKKKKGNDDFCYFVTKQNLKVEGTLESTRAIPPMATGCVNALPGRPTHCSLTQPLNSSLSDKAAHSIFGQLGH